jgi:excisionase family DNA binding protein
VPRLAALATTRKTALPGAVSRYVGVTGLDAVLDRIEAEAAHQREAFGNELGARGIEWAAAEVRQALKAEGSEELTLSEAARRSGYSEDHLRRLVRQGRIPDLRPSRRGPIRIQARDLPIKPGTLQIAGADAHGLASRPSGGTEGHHGH